MRDAHIETKTLRERAYEALKEMILMHDFLPNQALSIGSLASVLGISQTPVREALARLSADGLIEYESHRMPRVAAITEQDVHQVYEVRRLLEPYAANLIAKSLSKNTKLRKDLKRLCQKATVICKTPINHLDYEEYLSIDLKLNEVFLLGAGNTLLREVLAFVGDRSLRIRTFAEATSRSSPSSICHIITKEHLEIIESLLKGDGIEAQTKVCEHLNNGESRTLKAIRNRLSS